MIVIIIALGFLSFVGLGIYLFVKPKPIDSQLPLDSQSITDNKQNETLISRKWWAKKRVKYNLGLVVAGATAFLAYSITGSLLIPPFEITLFTTVFQGIGYLFMMLVANILYNLGHFVDRKFNKENSESYRLKLFNLGFWFSVGLPFLIPILVVITYFVHFRS